MTERRRLDVSIGEAGCLLYVADEGLGGRGFGQLDQLFSTSDAMHDVVRSGAIMLGSLYQDDGYNVRVVLGDLSDDEHAQWTSRAVGTLRLPTGRMVLSGIITPDLDDDLADFGIVTTDEGGEHELGCRIEIPVGEYEVSIYGYPPNDLAGGWMEIEDPQAYFQRTRPGEDVPVWISEGWEDAAFLDFVVQLRPLASSVELSPLGEDGCAEWTFREPEVCPAGIRL